MATAERTPESNPADRSVVKESLYQYVGASYSTEARSRLYLKLSKNPEDVHEIIYDRVAEGLRGDETVVDVGCGQGKFLLKMRDNGHLGPLIGINDNEDHFWLARRYIEKEGVDNLALVVGDAHKLPLGNESADVVTAQFLWYHVKYPWLAIDEARRILKPGGRLIAGLRSPDNLPKYFQIAQRAHEIINAPGPTPQSFYTHYGIDAGKADLSGAFGNLRVIHDKVKEMPVDEESWQNEYKPALSSFKNNPLISDIKHTYKYSWAIYSKALDRARDELYGDEIRKYGYFTDTEHQAILEAVKL